jgi:putative inorganic carbon (HCO3(-)) transporter
MRWAEPLGALLVILVFGLAPFVSNALTGVLLLACAGFWLLLTLSDDAESGAGFTPIHLLVLLYWWIATLATALSPVRRAAFEGWTKFTLYLLLFALVARLFRSPRIRSVVITAYLLTAAAVSVYGLRQWFFGADALATWVDPESGLADTTRVYSYLGNPNLLAAYLLPAIAFSASAVFAWKRWLPKLLAVLMWVINSACLVVTFSRGGWIGFVVAGFVLLVLLVHWYSIRFPRFWRILALPILLGVTAAVVVMAVLTIDPLRTRVFSIFIGREDSSNNFRMNVWMAAFRMIQDYPILGIGPGNDAFNLVYPHYQEAGYTALSAYSIYLDVAVATGLIGLGCFIWLLVVTFSQGWVRLQQLRQLGDREGFWLMAAASAMFGLMAHGLVDTVLERPQVSTIWWMLIGLIASYCLVSSTPTATAAEKPEEQPS